MTKKVLKGDLMDQLERNGTVGKYYEDMIEDWLDYWETKKELKADIKKRGNKVEKYDSKGQKQIVNNESSDLLIKITTQMQKILEFLGLKPPSTTQGGDDNDDEDM